MIQRTGEYIEKGDYHKSIDRDWSYYPVYATKMEYIEKYLKEHGKGKKILDAGCGEGVLVEKFKSRGFDIVGFDKHYESEFVQKDDILNSNFSDASFDLILCLDVLEHLTYFRQEKAVSEINRILKPGGVFLCTIPNLAHFTSRISFLFLGNLLHTSDVHRHIGDRPIREYLDIFKNKFTIIKRKGFFPTFLIISLLTVTIPSKVVWLHRLYNLTVAYPNWCFLNLVVCRKK